MPDIKFNYLYRDSGNCKKYGFVIFPNPENISLEDFETLVRSKLIDDQWFYADEWGLPELFLESCDFRIDPTWHEFDEVDFFNE